MQKVHANYLVRAAAAKTEAGLKESLQKLGKKVLTGLGAASLFMSSAAHGLTINEQYLKKLTQHTNLYADSENIDLKMDTKVVKKADGKKQVQLTFSGGDGGTVTIFITEQKGEDAAISRKKSGDDVTDEVKIFSDALYKRFASEILKGEGLKMKVKNAEKEFDPVKFE